MMAMLVMIATIMARLVLMMRTLVFVAFPVSVPVGASRQVSLLLGVPCVHGTWQGWSKADAGKELPRESNAHEVSC